MRVPCRPAAARAAVLTAVLFAAARPAAAQTRVLLEARLGGFAPTADLGASGGVRARMGAAPVLGLAAELFRGASPVGLRLGADVALPTGPNVEGRRLGTGPLDAQRTRDAALVSAGLDAVLRRRVAAADLRVALGGGLKRYAKPGGWATACPQDERSNLCEARVRFSRPQTDPALRLAVGARGLFGRPGLSLEVGDHVSRYAGGRVQHDVVGTVGVPLRRF